MKSNPNAVVAGGMTGAAAILAYVAAFAGLDLPVPVAVAGAGFLTTAALWIGRDGVRGILGRFWRGSQDGQSS